MKPNKALIGRAVISKEGDQIGNISDSIKNTKTGQIEFIKVKPNQNNKIINADIYQKNEYTYPASSFISVKDIIVVEEEPDEFERRKK